MADIQITGVDELNAKLAALTYETRLKGGRAALRKAANVLRDQARKNAAAVDDPQTSESIAKNITIRWSKRRFDSTGDLSFRVGVLGGARGFAAASGEVRGRGSSNPGGDTYYWRFLEFGTSKMRAQPFLRAATDQAAQQVIDTFIQEYGKALDRAIRRGAK